MSRISKRIRSLFFRDLKFESRRFRQLVFILIAGMVSLVGIGMTVWYASSVDQSFEMRRRAAAIPIFRITDEGVHQNSRIKIAVEDSYPTHVALDFITVRVDGQVETPIETVKIYRSPGSNVFYYLSQGLIGGDHRYFVRVIPDYGTHLICGANTDVPGHLDPITGRCILDPAPLLSSYYQISSPVGKLLYYDYLCNSGYVGISARDTNRTFFKVEISSSEKLSPWVDYFMLGFMVPHPSFQPKVGISYEVSLYTCTEYGVNCDVLLDQDKCAFVGCDGRVGGGWVCGQDEGFDIGVSQVQVPSIVAPSSPIDTRTTVRNFSNQSSGPYRLVVSLCRTPDCSVGDKLEVRSVARPGLGAMGSDIIPVRFAGRDAGQYIVNATVVPGQGDKDSSNNSMNSGVIAIGDPGVICIHLACPEGEVMDENCDCVDCVVDNNCLPREVCVDKKCVCDESLCGKGKIPSSDCSTCVCEAVCPPGHWQDDNCLCHPETCNLECGEREILMPDCTCKRVECTRDSHCSGLMVCDRSIYKCVCNVTCAPGRVVNSDCTACVCENTCGKGQIQRSDCVCIDEGTRVITDPDEVELMIIIPEDGDVFDYGGKTNLTYEILGWYDIDTDLIEWIVGGESAGSENSLPYIFNKTGEIAIVLNYGEEERDSIDVVVSTEDDEEVKKDKGDEEESTTLWERMRIWCLGGLGLLVLLLVVTMVAAYISRRQEEE